MKSLLAALNNTKVFKDLTPEEFSWVLYDVGNSAFIMLSCSLIPIWFKGVAIGTGAGHISSGSYGFLFYGYFCGYGYSCFNRTYSRHSIRP